MKMIVRFRSALLAICLASAAGLLPGAAGAQWWGPGYAYPGWGYPGWGGYPAWGAPYWGGPWWWGPGAEAYGHPAMQPPTVSEFLSNPMSPKGAPGWMAPRVPPAAPSGKASGK